MTAVTISPKYQVVIPAEIRKSMNLKPGMKLQVVAYGQTIHLVPVVDIKSLRGSLPGIDTTIIREPDREL